MTTNPCKLVSWIVLTYNLFCSYPFVRKNLILPFHQIHCFSDS